MRASTGLHRCVAYGEKRLVLFGNHLRIERIRRRNRHVEMKAQYACGLDPSVAHVIGIADPRVKGDPAGTPVVDVVTLGGRFRALATSGSAQHGDHIWDPTTGAGARHYVQVSVVAGDMVNADAWATAIAAGGEPVLSAALDAGFEALVITNERCDGTFGAHASAGWPSVLD